MSDPTPNPVNGPAIEPSTVIPLWPAVKAPTGVSEKYESRGPGPASDGWLSRISEPTLAIYHPEAVNQGPGVAVIICPGGGYAGLAIDKEGHHPARWLASLGITAAVLKYRMPDHSITGDGDPLPLLDVRRAMEIVRGRSAEWNLDRRRIGIMGFSAGGHAAAMACTLAPTTGPDSYRPNFAVLIYPVISMHPPLAHAGSCENLLGKNPGPARLNRYSLDGQVTAKNPPTFLVHAQDDHVLCQNSEQMHAALTAAGVTSTLLKLQTGGHGFGLGIRGGEPAGWPGKCADWLAEQAGLHRSFEKQSLD